MTALCEGRRELVHSLTWQMFTVPGSGSQGVLGGLHIRVFASGILGLPGSSGDTGCREH